jgi:hypothetical protein
VFKVALVLPITSSSGDHSFSIVYRIHLYEDYYGENKLTDLAVIYKENYMKIDTEVVLKSFLKKK